MDKRNYIKEYEKYSGLFKKHFGENADIYWKMYLNYHVDHISYDKLGILHNISKTTVRNILKRIESFLQDPWKIMREVDYSIKLLDGYIYICQMSLYWVTVDYHLMQIKYFMKQYICISMECIRRYQEAMFYGTLLNIKM